MAEKRTEEHERARAYFRGLESRGPSAEAGEIRSVSESTKSHTKSVNNRNIQVTEQELRERVEADEYCRNQNGDVPHRVDEFCEAHPVSAFEIATDVLTRIAATARSMNERSGQALALMEARSERIDRMQAENRKLLDSLVTGNWP